MSTGYLILYYKNNMIESYIKNFLMTKYISLNNAIGSNKLISKIKYYHRNYFCFINKEKNAVRCIIKLGKITNYQNNLEIKSQQEVLLLDLKNSEIFKNESKIIENFFNLENNNNENYIKNKINLLIKESNNVYEFNCILLENSYDMGIFEKIKRCMKDKENNHNNEIQNNLRRNPLTSAIFSYQAAFRKKNPERNINNVSGNNLNNNLNKDGEDKNIYKETIYLDMKYDKYFLYDELLIDKKQKDENFFPKIHLDKYNELEERNKGIFKIADIIFKKPFIELYDIKDELNIGNMGNYNEPQNINNNKINNSDNINNNFNDYKNKEDIKINLENNNLKPINNNINKNILNYSSNNANINRIINNISIIKEDIRNDNNEINANNLYIKNNDNYISNYKKDLGVGVPYNNFINNNYNNRDYNNNYKYYNSNSDNNKYVSGINPKKNQEKQYSNQMRNNSYNNNSNNNYIKNRNERDQRNDNYMNDRNDNNIRNYSSNDYNYNSSHSHSSSFASERGGRGKNYSRSREKSPFHSPNKNSMRYNNMNSPPQKKYEKYERYNERNSSYKNNNYYGNNNNINYYYNINNYYRPGSSNSWNDYTYHHQGGNYQRDNYQQNKNVYYNNNYYNYEGHYNRERRRGNQNSNY